MSNFKEAWDSAWKRTEQKLWVFAKMGKINPDGSYTFDVPGRATFVYVTLRSDSSTGGQTVVAARNDAGVEHAPRLNIKMRLEQGVYVIYGRTGREDLGSNPATPPSGVISHNHDDLYYEKTDFIETGGNTAFGNLPIKTLPTGLIDDSFLPPLPSAFTDLTDVPSSYTGAGGQAVMVSATEDGLEFVDPVILGLAAMPLVQTSVPSATVGSASTSSFATKGVRVTPSKDMQVYGIAFVGNTVASASYKPYCFTFGGGTVANLVTGTVYTVASSGETLTSKRHWLWFSSPISLTAGTEYGFAIGRTDSTNTYVLPFETVSGYKIPFNNQGSETGFVRIAKAVPANGDTVDSSTTGDMFMMGFCWSFNDEAVTVYALPADVGGSVNAATTDNTLDDTDTLPYTTGSTLKKTAWSVIKSTLKTYFDTLYTFANIVTNNSITNALLRDSGALSVIGRSANSSGDPADISATATSDAVLRESGSVLGFGTVATGGIAANAVTNAKAAQMAANTLKSNITGSTANAADNDITTVLAQYIHAATSKNPPVDADELALIDSAASNVLKKLTWANLKAAIKTYYDSLATSLTNKTLDSTNIASLTAKNPPVDADSVVIVDSVASNVFKAVTGTNLKAYLKTYFDGLYGLLAAANTWAAGQIFNVNVLVQDSGGSSSASFPLMISGLAAGAKYVAFALNNFSNTNDSEVAMRWICRSTTLTTLINRIGEISLDANSGASDLVFRLSDTGALTEFMRIVAATSSVGINVPGPAATLDVLQPTLGSPVLQLASTASNDDPTEQTVQNKVTTTTATITTIHTFTVPASTTYFITGVVVARRTGGSAGTAEDGAAYTFQANYKNVAGTATLIGPGGGVTSLSEDQAGWDCTLSPTGATVRLRVTGATNNNISWVMTARIYPVSS